MKLLAILLAICCCISFSKAMTPPSMSVLLFDGIPAELLVNEDENQNIINFLSNFKTIETPPKKIADQINQLISQNKKLKVLDENIKADVTSLMQNLPKYKSNRVSIYNIPAAKFIHCIVGLDDFMKIIRNYLKILSKFNNGSVGSISGIDGFQVPSQSNEVINHIRRFRSILVANNAWISGIYKRPTSGSTIPINLSNAMSKLYQIDANTPNYFTFVKDIVAAQQINPF